MTDEIRPGLMTIRLDEPLARRIQEWRERRIEKQSKSQAIRWLIKLGLREAAKQEEKA